jgi:hypothetical protein
VTEALPDDFEQKCHGRVTVVSGSRWASAAPLLVVVCWIMTTLAVVGVRRYAAWDEAVYLAKGLGPPTPISWGPQRSLGMPIITSFVTWADAPVAGVRLWVLTVNGAVAFLTLRVWYKLIGLAGIIGPALIMFSWIGLFSAGEIYPNFATAVFALWAVGAGWSWVVSSQRTNAIQALLATAGVGLVRPTALGWLFLGLLVATLLEPTVRSEARRLLAGAGFAIVVALTPWVIESFARFDGPIQRLRSGRTTIVGYDIGHPVTAYLSTLTTSSVGAGMWRFEMILLVGLLSAFTAAAILGFMSAPRHVRAPMALAGCTGIAKVSAYLILPSTAAARFLLPGLLLLSVPVGVGLSVLALRRPVRLALIALFIPLVTLQLAIARNVAVEETQGRARLEQLGVQLAREAGDSPCVFHSRYGYPSVQLRSGCIGRRTTDPTASFDRLAAEPNDVRVFVLWTGELEAPAGWAELAGEAPESWRVFGRDTG